MDPIEKNYAPPGAPIPPPEGAPKPDPLGWALLAAPALGGVFWAFAPTELLRNIGGTGMLAAKSG